MSFTSRGFAAPLVLALAIALAGLSVPVGAHGEVARGHATESRRAAMMTSHKDPTMLDLSTPYFEGYKKKLKAYKFTIYGRWNPVCDGKFCWSSPCANCNKQDVGSNDAVRIRFSDAVSFRKMAIENRGACGDRYFREAKRFSSGSFEDAFAGVNDEVVTSWKHTTFNGEDVINKGYCKRPDLPTTSGAAGSSGGSGTYKLWGDLKGRAFKYSVWVNPLPSRGRCYDRLYVKAGYTHTWTDEGLTWSAGYPWSIGVGVSETNGSFTAWQDSDGHADPQLSTPRMCKH